MTILSFYYASTNFGLRFTVTIEIRRSMAQHIVQILSIYGNLFATSTGKYYPPAIDLMLSGFTIAVVMKLKMKGPIPKPACVTPEAVALLFGYHSQEHIIGTQ